MTEAEWLACTDPRPMLEFLRGKVSERKLRLLTVACCRLVWHDIPGELGASAELAERCTDGSIGLEAIREQSRQLYEDYCSPRGNPAKLQWVHRNKQAQALFTLVFGTTYSPVQLSRLDRSAVWDYGLTLVVDHFPNLIRDIHGNPFRPVTSDPRWLTPTVTERAEAIYAERAFDRLPAGPVDEPRRGVGHTVQAELGGEEFGPAAGGDQLQPGPDVRSNRAASRSTCEAEVAPNRTSFECRSHSTGVHFRRLNRPSFASCSSRSRALSLASRFCLADDRAVLQAAARGDTAALEKARPYLTDKRYIARWGSPVYAAKCWIVSQACGDDKVVARATHNRADQLADELRFQEASALERLAITRVVHDWLMVGVLEAKACGWKPHTRERSQVERCLSQAERRLMQAVKALAFLRQCHPAGLAARLPAAAAMTLSSTGPTTQPPALPASAR